MSVLSIVGSLTCRCEQGGADRDRPESRSAACVRLARGGLRSGPPLMTMDVYTQIPTPETRKALDRLNQSLNVAGET